MSRSRRFRYALQPVLLTRRWHYEELQRELGDLNARQAQCAAALHKLRAQQAHGHAAWIEQARAPQELDAWLRQSAYFAAQQAKIAVLQAQMREFEQQGAELIGRLHLAQRALDGVERHRGQTEVGFLRRRMSKEYEQADEMWNGRTAPWVAR
jgi:outer membrane murein-binding lipoprotein Lpp